MQIPKKVGEWIKQQIPEQVREDFRKLKPVGISFLVLFLAVGVSFPFYQRFPERSLLEFGLLLGVLLGPFLGSLNSARKNANKDLNKKEILTDVSKLYLEGKMQRYTLLFSVNGGAFAIIKFSHNANGMPGLLRMPALSMGLILFTLLMVSDIWLWGTEMRQKHGAELFRPVGQMILLMIGALLVAGWLLIVLPES